MSSKINEKLGYYQTLNDSITSVEKHKSFVSGQGQGGGQLDHMHEIQNYLAGHDIIIPKKNNFVDLTN